MKRVSRRMVGFRVLRVCSRDVDEDDWRWYGAIYFAGCECCYVHVNGVSTVVRELRRMLLQLPLLPAWHWLDPHAGQ